MGQRWGDLLILCNKINLQEIKVNLTIGQHDIAGVVKPLTFKVWAKTKLSNKI